jgi:hypothetical protein
MWAMLCSNFTGEQDTHQAQYFVKERMVGVVGGVSNIFCVFNAWKWTKNTCIIIHESMCPFRLEDCTTTHYPLPTTLSKRGLVVREIQYLYHYPVLTESWESLVPIIILAPGSGEWGKRKGKRKWELFCEWHYSRPKTEWLPQLLQLPPDTSYLKKRLNIINISPLSHINALPQHVEFSMLHYSSTSRRTIKQVNHQAIISNRILKSANS